MTNAKRYRLDKICSNQLEKWESEYPVNNEIMYLAWKDKKQVKILSTVFSKDSIETTTYNKKTKRYDKINKPKLVVSYSRNMKGVDINNILRPQSVFNKNK